MPTRLHELRRQIREAHTSVRGFPSPTHPKPARAPRRPCGNPSLSFSEKGGAGTELKAMLALFGFIPEDGKCACKQLAYRMDRLGPTWCRTNLPFIQREMEAEIARREIESPETAPYWTKPIARLGGLHALLKLAIHKAERKGSISRVFLIGYPGAMGGANTEALHLLRLWKSHGWEVNLVPTWNCAPDNEARMTALGYITHHATPENLGDVPNLPGSITVGMCNSHYMSVYGNLRQLGCKTVWINCMTFLFPHERQAYAAWGTPDACVYQSHFQQTELERSLQPYGYRPETSHMIRGAFDPAEIPWNPASRAPTDPFTVGKLARPDADKWYNRLFSILAPIPNRRALLMGCRPETYLKIGEPPDWAECLAPMQISVPDFLHRCHALITVNGGARENWPRVGLEAMSAGVPILAPNAWGWQEMIVHGETGFLCDSDTDYARYGSLLASDEPLRQRIAMQAREHLLTRLAPTDELWLQWDQLFHSLYSKDEVLA